jgi:hypothetical protein
MKIIITESQNYILRRIQQLNDIVEYQINLFKINNNHILNNYWCKEYNNADDFFTEVSELSVGEFIRNNWDFFHPEKDKSLDGFHFLMKFVEENYGNYIRNLYVRKCH